MKKKVITKPRFGKIFAVSFLISLFVCLPVAIYLLYQIDNEVWEKVDSERSALLDSIVKQTRTLYLEGPNAEGYEQDLIVLKEYIADYQTFDHSYIEVNVDGQNITVDDDTAYFFGYLIENMSYLDPLNEYMDGLFDKREQDEIYRRFGRDPIFDDANYIGKYDKWMTYHLATAYINDEDHTFLPGMIFVHYKGQKYDFDCTPADTKGYEEIDLTEDITMFLNIKYRATPDLTSSDFSNVIVCDTEFYTDEISYEEYADLLSKGKMNDYAWYIGYSQPHYSLPPVLTLAPVSSAIIIADAIFIAAIAALIFSVIRYQKDKTLWSIFEYRIKTTEAMAHDLKTPLSTMMFHLEDLEDSSEDPEKVREYAKTLNDKVVGMDHMIADILQFSRSESGKVDLNKEKVSVKELVFESLKEFPEMKTEIRGEDISLMTDRKILAQVIMNLLSNCDRYGRKGEVVDIEFAPEAVTISNKTDKTYEDADSLKKPFVKGDNSRGNKGTGLGLAIADNALSILGYKLELSSEADEFKAKVKFR